MCVCECLNFGHWFQLSAVCSKQSARWPPHFGKRQTLRTPKMHSINNFPDCEWLKSLPQCVYGVCSRLLIKNLHPSGRQVFGQVVPANTGCASWANFSNCDVDKSQIVLSLSHAGLAAISLGSKLRKNSLFIFPPTNCHRSYHLAVLFALTLSLSSSQYKHQERI